MAKRKKRSKKYLKNRAVEEKGRKKFVEYTKHIQSDEWKAKRDIAKKINSRCVLCGRSGNSIHHRSYRRLGEKNEKYDIITLCMICHNLFHAHYEYNKEKHYFEPRIETVQNFREFSDEVIIQKLKELS